MKNVTTFKMVSALTLMLSVTACIPRGDMGFGTLTPPNYVPAPTVPSQLEATAAALSAAVSVVPTTCSNGTQGLLVTLEGGSTATVACGGTNGADGNDGAPGAPGANGQDGVNGADGDKKMAVYDASGAATGLVYVTNYTNSLIILHHPATGMNIAYNMPWSSIRPSMMWGTTESIYFESANCSGQGYFAFGLPVGNTIFKNTVQNKYYKHTGLYRTDLAMNSRLDGSDCKIAAPSSAGFVAIEEVTLPAGINETLKQPVTLKYE